MRYSAKFYVHQQSENIGRRQLSKPNLSTRKCLTVEFPVSTVYTFENMRCRPHIPYQIIHLCSSYIHCQVSVIHIWEYKISATSVIPIPTKRNMPVKLILLSHVHFLLRTYFSLQIWIRQIFRIGTARYAEGLWRMRRHGPVMAHCTNSEDFPWILHKPPRARISILSASR